MEIEKLNFAKTGENLYAATFETKSDHDVLQAALPDNVGMTVYARVPGETGRQAIGSISSLAARDVLCELAVPSGLEIVVECSRKGAENASAVIARGE